jgi:hypothetical protein
MERDERDAPDRDEFEDVEEDITSGSAGALASGAVGGAVAGGLAVPSGAAAADTMPEEHLGDDDIPDMDESTRTGG